MDSDHVIGFWIKKIPYVWVPNKSLNRCKRYYIVGQNEFAIFNEQNEITTLTALLKTISHKDYSIIPIETNNKNCVMVRNMFLVALVKTFFNEVNSENIYNLYKTDDVRIEGEKINKSKVYKTQLIKYAKIDISHYVRYNEYLQLYDAAFGRANGNVLNVTTAAKSLVLTTRNGINRYSHLAEAQAIMKIPKNRLKNIHLEALNNAYNLIKNQRIIIPKHKLGLDSWLHDDTIELIEKYIVETDEDYKIIQDKQYGVTDEKFMGWLYQPKYTRYDIMQIIYETLIGKRKVYNVINL